MKDLFDKVELNLKRVESEDITEMVPRYAINKAEQNKLLLEGELSMLDIALHELRAADPTALIEGAKSKLEAANKASQTLENLVEEAVAHKAAAAAAGA